jgi:SAM-dependent methyltransferase
MTLQPEINICIVQPPGYIHSMAFLEVARYFQALVARCGLSSVIKKNWIAPHQLNIIVGGHLLRDASNVPADAVIFNSEQLPEKEGWFQTDTYGQLLKTRQVWDYSQANLDCIDNDRKSKVSFLHCEELRTIAREPEKDIDLLFYGSVNDRRKGIIEDLMAAGVRVATLAGIYGPERDAVMARARAVLNLHIFDAQIFQQVRCFYPLINGIPVVSEDYRAGSAPPAYEDVLFLSGKTPMAVYAAKLLKNHAKFAKLAEAKLEEFRRCDPLPEFSAALEAALAAHRRAGRSPAGSTPKKINLGSGKDYRPGYLNIDVNPSVGADLILDLSQRLDLPHAITSPSLGKIRLETGAFSEIIANDVLEHVRDLPTLMTQCLELLETGGRFAINVPYELSCGAWQDPTHVRAFNENSWLYFTDWFWYLGWFRHRFEVVELTYVLSDLGKGLQAGGTAGAEIIRTPRAVDSMNLVLVKRETSPEERQIARAYSPDFHLDSRSEDVLPKGVAKCQ